MKQDVFPVGQGARKRRSQWLAFGIFKLLSYSIVLILFAILGFIIYKGIGVISWEFLTTAPSDGMTGGGIWPAIVGTFYLMGISNRTSWNTSRFSIFMYWTMFNLFIFNWTMSIHNIMSFIN